MATQLVESMSGPWKPENYRDTYRDKVDALIADKKRGRQTVVEAEPPDPTEMADLLAALERSVEDAKAGRRGRAGTAEAGAKKKGKKEKKGKKKPDLDGASKADLAAKARDLDIKGRSTMTRDELADAIRQAS